MDKKKLVIIDSYSILFKAYYAIRDMHTLSGTPTSAVFGFLNMLISLVKDQKPDYLFAAFDHTRKNFRHEIFGDYKANRQETPEDLKIQSSLLKDILAKMNIPILEIPGFEADDILGTASVHVKEEGVEPILVSGDRDSFALASDNAKILYCRKGVSDTVLVDPKYIMETYGVEPKDLTTVKSLMGDASDNIPGVKGIGEKTALELVKTYKTLDNIYSHIDDFKGAKKEKLINGKEMAYTSYDLAKINCHVDIDFDYEAASQFDLAREDAVVEMEKLELNSIVKKLVGESQKKTKEPENKMDLKIDSTLFDEKNSTPVLSTIKSGTELISFFYSQERTALYILVNNHVYILKLVYLNSSVLKSLSEALMHKKIICNDVKPLAKLFLQNKVDMPNFIFDTSVAGYVLDPTDSRYEIYELCSKYLGEVVKKEDYSPQKQVSLLEEDDESEFEALSHLCLYLEPLYDKMTSLIKENEMEYLYYQIEHKLIFVLAKMEVEGVRIDTVLLDELGEKYNREIEELNKKIKEAANQGEDFNPNSTKQLGELLFDKLKLPVIKKTKTGYSTDVEVLEALKGMHPIIDMILRLRQISKLYSTYIVGLKAAIDKEDGKVHTTFNQTITETGRISSSNPNLQNIPIRTKEGEILRKLFIADEGETLIDGDYSQIELRVLSHVAKDKVMQQSFNDNEDIHTRTASEVFGVSMEEVTSDMRRRAKAVNFGIIYGISDFGLSRDLGISRQQAKEYIEKYLSGYKGVSNFMNETVDYAKQNGFVKTIFGRKRTLPGINSRNFNLRSFNERTALNTPIQGSAADIIKLAMIKVDERLSRGDIDAKLILQVHDELILTCKKEDAKKVAFMLDDVMENAVKLDVVLKADVNTGDCWYDAK